MKWNEAQLQAIETRGKHILVSAAAGSGKTAVLVERIKQLIIKDGIDIEKMLIVTFTNAAAAEMRERIYLAITAAMETEEAQASFLRDQLGKIGTANISTFHSFCMGVIRRYFYLSDVAPDFKICDEIQKAIFQEEAMDKLLEEAFEWESDEIDFKGFARRFSTAENERNIRAMVTQTHNFIQSLPKPMVWLHEKIAELKQSEHVLERQTYEDGLVLERLVKRYDELYKEQKRRKNLLDFSDIEHISLELLDFPEPQREYRGQFSYIFVDEYQDSNIVQEALLRKIIESNYVFMVGDVKQSIYKFRLAEPEIFLEKYEQYKNGQIPDSMKIDLNENFRSKGNILQGVNQIFQKIMTRETGGMDYQQEAMLYQGIHTPEDVNYPVELHVVDDRQVESNGMDSEVDQLDPEIVEMKKTELEATVCAGVIRDAIGTEFFDWKTGSLRKTTYRDVVILFRGFKTNAEIYQEVLQREGIPVYAEGGDGYFDTVEVNVFTNLLKIIDNRRQDIALLSVMKSVIGGFSLEEIAQIRIFQPTGLYANAFLQYGEAGPEGILQTKVKALLEKISRWRELVKQMPLRDFLWKLADETLYYEFIGALPEGEQRKANIRLLIDKAHQYQSATTQGLFGFIHYLEQMKKTGVSVGKMKLLGEGDDVVRMMSIHKSKGLEFPTVIVGGIGKKFNRSKASANVSFDRTIGIGIRYHDREQGYYIKTPKQKQIDEAKKNEETAEEMRILYVALTRAKERLILLGTVKGDPFQLAEKSETAAEAKSYLEWMLNPLIEWTQSEPEKMCIFTHDRITIGEREKDQQAVVTENLNEMKNGFALEAEAEKRIQQAVFRRMDFRYPHQDSSLLASKYTVSEINAMAGKGKMQPEIPTIRRELLPLEQEGVLTAAERGTATHKVMQGITVKEILSAQEPMEELKKQMLVMREKDLLTEKELEAVNTAGIMHFVQSDLGKRIAASQQIKKEQSFNLLETATQVIPEWKGMEDEDHPIMIQGTLDCFFEESDGYVLLDYKTDYLPSVGRDQAISQKVDQYETQMDLYCRAIEASTGKSVKEAYLYFLSCGDAVSLSSPDRPKNNRNNREC